MSEVLRDRPNAPENTKTDTQHTATLVGRIFNSNTITTALTCAIFTAIIAVCFRPTSDGGGGGGDPSGNIVKKLAEMENRINALSNVTSTPGHVLTTSLLRPKKIKDVVRTWYGLVGRGRNVVRT